MQSSGMTNGWRGERKGKKSMAERRREAPTLKTSEFARHYPVKHAFGKQTRWTYAMS